MICQQQFGRVLPVLVCALLAVSMGCSGERMYPVSGKVTLDDRPIETGSITFEAADGGAGAFSGGIQNGTFTLQSTAGLKKVSVVARRVRQGAHGPTPDMENYIPIRYNRQTTLTAKVKPEASNHFEFSLESP